MQTRYHWTLLTVLPGLICCGSTIDVRVIAQETNPAALQVPAVQPTTAVVDMAAKQEMINRAVEYLKLSGQDSDGSFSKANGVGVTAVVAAGLTSVGVPSNSPLVSKAFEYLSNNVRQDGGIYGLNSTHANYETCIAAMAFSKANQDGRYDQLLKNADAFIRKGQWDEDEDLTPEDLKYGGAGYGSKSRPDLSNTAFMIEALHELGATEDDPAIQKALIFITRCQNLESSQNSSPYAAKVDDGGFYYTVAAGGASMAGETENGGLRSYPAMTYAGLKSMIYAGLDDQDPRVAAAKKFLQSNYAVDSNPGLGKSGLYYYYQTMAKALQANGEPIFETASGKRNWQVELFSQLQQTQSDNGSWTNEDKRWMESDPNLVTGYVLLTLANLGEVK